MNARRLTATVLFSATAMAALSGCKSEGEIVVNSGVGITAVRSACPAVGIPDFTGDMTLFAGNGAQIADNIDVTATMTDVRAICADNTEGRVASQVTFTVQGMRTDTRGARTVTLPYFVTVLQGGSAVVSKRIGQVTLNFADGQARAEAMAAGTAYVDRAAATLPDEVRRRIVAKRRAGDADAALDPLADPTVKAAIARATFEVLVGFQLNDAQIQYNATR